MPVGREVFVVARNDPLHCQSAPFFLSKQIFAVNCFLVNFNHSRVKSTKYI